MADTTVLVVDDEASLRPLTERRPARQDGRVGRGGDCDATVTGFRLYRRAICARMTASRGARREAVLDLAVIILGLACGVALLQGIIGGEA